MKTKPPHREAGTLTLEEFERLPDDDGWQLELIRGQVVREPPAGFNNSGIGVRIATLLDQFVRANNLGRVVGADAGFVLFVEPPTVRVPDVAFVRKERLAFDGERFAPHAPDLAVEVIGPTDTMSQTQAKVIDYLDAGTRLVWVVDPKSRSVEVYRSRNEIRLIPEDGDIDGGDALPGFRLDVSQLFSS
ncbi:MAG: Uma2 family endonuclease [Gemmatimonadota bacterium]